MADSSWWDYQARREAKRKREEQTDVHPVLKDPWKGIEVKEHRLSDTGIMRFLARIRRKK